jgi:hypothetical protein
MSAAGQVEAKGEMNAFLTWLEATWLSSWVRESPSVFAFPAILACHTVGMGLVAGINAALALRILGAAPGVPIREMKRFLPVMWFGFWLNAVSGVVLLIAYPTKALTNPVFYLKLLLIAAAVALVRPISRRVFGDGSSSSPSSAPDRRTVAGPGVAAVPRGGHARLLAVASIACWFGAITAGRLLAYTYTRLMAML